ncbi:winged helix-turn-helix domain-containing protein [bacterium AH-315-L15]|nr:winged helix-turn-helix domain-containing protein [bacterium AH-315-L15]
MHSNVEKRRSFAAPLFAAGNLRDYINCCKSNSSSCIIVFMSIKIELRNQKRKEVVEAIVIRQEPVHLVRRIYDIPERTIFNWLSLYRSGGWDALKEGARSGRPRKLSCDDMKWVYNAVTMGNPQNYKFDFSLWTLNILRALIYKERGIKLSKSAVSRLLGHLGLRPQRPIYQSYKQDPRKIAQYLSESFPEAVAQAQAGCCRFLC